MYFLSGCMTRLAKAKAPNGKCTACNTEITEEHIIYDCHRWNVARKEAGITRAIRVPEIIQLLGNNQIYTNFLKRIYDDIQRSIALQ